MLNRAETISAKRNTRNLICAATATGMRGDTLKQTDLAATLKRIQLEGRDGSIKAKQPGSSWKKCRQVTASFLMMTWQTHDAVWRHPLQFRYHEYTIISMPPPSRAVGWHCTTAGDAGTF